ncbi:hypothetical protein D5R81_02880 [Parashewanella spongiae]|uniref:Uncharacterized protein n=1 Tax=Parashewanella spongiae TaxID=342950 RepID=A0A3A6U4N7_9GAMM|nr:hypothetical protein [Parashewanella spongiae]MCL1077380.1 hypothetical protein [Parashewanella spongiae]RJY18994.1 hypothetical protein D5R81_02880 [Parashewanella spongiae]
MLTPPVQDFQQLTRSPSGVEPASEPKLDMLISAGSNDFHVETDMETEDRAVSNFLQETETQADHVEPVTAASVNDVVMADTLFGSKCEATLFLLEKRFSKVNLRRLLFIQSQIIPKGIAESIEKAKNSNARLLDVWMERCAGSQEANLNHLINAVENVDVILAEQLRSETTSIEQRLSNAQTQVLTQNMILSTSTYEERIEYLEEKISNLIKEQFSDADLDNLLFIIRSRRLCSAQCYSEFTADTKSFDNKAEGAAFMWLNNYLQKKSVSPNDSLQKLAEVVQKLGKVVAATRIKNL